MSQVTIYSTPWCAFCKAEKEFLDQKGVAYHDIDVEADLVAAEEMIKKSGQLGVPVTVITRDDESEAVKVGYDQEWLTSELKPAK